MEQTVQSYREQIFRHIINSLKISTIIFSIYLPITLFANLLINEVTTGQ